MDNFTVVNYLYFVAVMRGVVVITIRKAAIVAVKLLQDFIEQLKDQLTSMMVFVIEELLIVITVEKV